MPRPPLLLASAATLARTFRLAGLPLRPSLDLAEGVEGVLATPGALPARPTSFGPEVDVVHLMAVACRVLTDSDEGEAMRRLRVRWWIRRRQVPFVLAEGGTTSGLGKSTVSQAAATALGIDTVLSTDMVRQHCASPCILN